MKENTIAVKKNDTKDNGISSLGGEKWWYINSFFNGVNGVLKFTLILANVHFLFSINLTSPMITSTVYSALWGLMWSEFPKSTTV